MKIYKNSEKKTKFLKVWFIFYQASGLIWATKRFRKNTHGSSPSILGMHLKISDQNNWGVPEQKIKFGGGGGRELNLRET